MAIQWSNWASLGRPSDTELGRPFASRNQDGRLEVFATAQGAIFNIWQVAPNGAWADGWHDKGIPQSNVEQLIAHVVGRNADGRQEIFAVADFGTLFHKWQVAPNGGWSNWASLDRPPTGIRQSDHLTIGTNQDGRLEVFVVGEDGRRLTHPAGALTAGTLP
jgi:hypothetical protein